MVAQLVKEYVLPMFESDGKKQLKSKHNKMASLGAGGKSAFSHDIGNPNSVYGELKLSEKLSNELNKIRE
jgi:hypothetical protein